MRGRSHDEAGAMKKMGMVIGIRPEKIAEYKALHAHVWPDVLTRLAQSNIRNYSIFLREPENLLFGYWEYNGDDFDADMAAIADHAPTRRWWMLTDSCQQRLTSARGDERWAFMQQVFNL
jgi:L-rhamnose mutarotase